MKPLSLVVLAVALASAIPLPASAGGAVSQREDGDAASDALALLGVALLDMRHGHVVSACEGLERVVRLTPTWPLARFELGRCLRLLGDPQAEASRHLEAAEEGLRSRGVVLVERGRLAEDQGETTRARAYFKEAAALTPGDVRAWAGAARLGVAEDPQRSLVAARRLVARWPGDVAAWRRLAEVAEEADALDEAESALRRVGDLSANPVAAAAALGRFGQRHGRRQATQAASRLLSRR